MGIERFMKKSGIESSEPLDDIPEVPQAPQPGFGLTHTSQHSAVVSLPDVPGIEDLTAALRTLAKQPDDADSKTRAQAALDEIKDWLDTSTA